MPNKNTRLALNLFAVVIGMLLLAYASVPLYRIFCQATGYNGTTQEATHAPDKILNREITVDFNTDIDPRLHWAFTPPPPVKVKIGQQMLVHFTAKNLENSPVTGRAVYNVVPLTAGAYFTKIQCFCFKQQTLAAGQIADMPVLFYVDPSIAQDREMDDVTTITLSYTFFPVEK